jgi:tetratricopeptide (TPR) repeat protein
LEEFWRQFFVGRKAHLVRIVPLKGEEDGVRKFGMKPVLGVALLLACSVAAGPRICAQGQTGGDANSSNSSGSSGQKKQSGNAQQPAAPADANPFPEDESTVPVIPSKGTPDLPPGSFGGSDSGHAALPAGDVDPVASPDDAAGSGDAQPASGFSSSDSGLGSLLNGPDDEPQGKHGQRQVEPEHKETAQEDENVGKYYLDGKDWRAALSRYQSAMVLDPDNPDVYWGLAESNRHLGNYADARANYLKVMEYDPGSRHAKDAAKALKEPDLANAKATPPAQPGAKNQ